MKNQNAMNKRLLGLVIGLVFTIALAVPAFGSREAEIISTFLESGRYYDYWDGALFEIANITSASYELSLGNSSLAFHIVSDSPTTFTPLSQWPIELYPSGGGSAFVVETAMVIPPGIYEIFIGKGVSIILTALGSDVASPAPSPPPAAPVPAEVSVIINGALQSFEVPPQIINGRTMLPLRAIGEALGMEVGFDSAANTATLTALNLNITHVIQTNVITVNGFAQTFDASSVIADGRTLVPVRMIADAMGTEIDWDDSTRTVAIVTGYFTS